MPSAIQEREIEKGRSERELKLCCQQMRLLHFSIAKICLLCLATKFPTHVCVCVFVFVCPCVCVLVFVLSVLEPFACTLYSEEVLHNLFTNACNITHTPIGTFPIQGQLQCYILLYIDSLLIFRSYHISILLLGLKVCAYRIKAPVKRENENIKL